MKRLIASFAILAACSASLPAVPAKVVDTDGQATVRRTSGKTEPVALGKSYDTGDSIRTGKDGLVELSQEGLTIRVGPGTVFTLMEKDLGGKPKGILAVTLGTVKVKYERLTGAEPLIQSVGCIAGVRGTELTIWAGADGASRLIVDSGLVSVEASDSTVDLGPGEAVEVVNGRAPGDKFLVEREKIDHASWDAGRIEALLADPLAALDGLSQRLWYYSANALEYYAQQQETFARLGVERTLLGKVREEKGKEAADAYEKEFVTPLVHDNASLVLNYRYFALAALSMRRFVGGRMYLLLKMKYLSSPDDPAWTGFVARYEVFVSDFEASIMPVLVDADF